MIKNKLLYFGYGSMFKHKRGVENVIDFQSKAFPEEWAYYFHWDTTTSIRRYSNLICIGIKKDYLWWLTLNFILYKLDRRNCGIYIHSHNPLMSLVSFKRSNLFTVHDGLFYNAKSKGHRLRYIFFPLEIFLYLRCDYLHFISNFAKEKSLYKNRHYVIIPNTSHYESKYWFNMKYSKTNFENDNFKILTVRSIEERALIDLIIEVARKLVNEKIEFVVVGKGPLLDFYRNKIDQLGLSNISLLGYLSDEELLSYYKDCDLVLSPASYGEGFGLPIIEGYLFDKPVIASNVCAIPEVIISPDYLFDNNVESVISRLNFVRMQENISYYDYYRRRFSNEDVIFKFKELYIKLNEWHYI